MKNLIDTVKFAMGNNGNPLIVTQDSKREIAEALIKEFSAKAVICFSMDEIDNAIDSSGFDVVVFDGDSKYRDHLDKLFAKFPKARRVCFAKSDFWQGNEKIYDTVITG